MRGVDTHNFYYCCGFEEMNFDSLRNKYQYRRDLTAKMLAKEFKELLKDRSLSSFILTDTYKNKLNCTVNKLVTKIVKPIAVGKNPNSDNYLYI